jgi:hypothetical protein
VDTMHVMYMQGKYATQCRTGMMGMQASTHHQLACHVAACACQKRMHVAVACKDYGGAGSCDTLSADHCECMVVGVPKTGMHTLSLV